MATLELVVSGGVPGDPSNMGNADYVAVEVSLENACAAVRHGTIVAPGLDLGGILQVLSMSVHLSQNGSDLVVLHTEFIHPFLVVSAGLIRYWHILQLLLRSKVDVIHWSVTCRPGTIQIRWLPLSFQLYPGGDYIS